MLLKAYAVTLPFWRCKTLFLLRINTPLDVQCYHHRQNVVRSFEDPSMTSTTRGGNIQPSRAKPLNETVPCVANE